MLSRFVVGLLVSVFLWTQTICPAHAVDAMRARSGDSPVVAAGLEQILTAGAEELPFDQTGARQLGFEAAVRQELGHRRSQQDDRVLVTLGRSGEKPAGILAVLADGMGGHAAGDLASRMAVVRIPAVFQASDVADLLQQYEAATDPGPRRDLGGKIQERIKQAVEQAHVEIRELGDLVEQYQDTNEPAEKEKLKAPIQDRAGRFGKVFDFNDPKIQIGRPGSTVVVALATPSTAFIASIGDSRIYLYRQRFGLSQQTHDDAYYGDLIEYLGKETTFGLQQRMIPLQSADRLLLVSDGVTKSVPDNDIEQTLASDPTAEGAADALMAAARQGSDNRTVVLLDAPLQSGPAPAPEVPAPEPPVNRLIFQLGLNKIQEMRIAVVSFEAAQAYPELQPLAGRLIQMGNAWLFVLPQRASSAAQWDLLGPLRKAPMRPFKFWEYGESSSSPTLRTFDWLARTEHLDVIAREPVQGWGFQDLLGHILANLRGIQPDAVKPDDIQLLEEILRGFV